MSPELFAALMHGLSIEDTDYGWSPRGLREHNETTPEGINRIFGSASREIVPPNVDSRFELDIDPYQLKAMWDALRAGGWGSI